MLDTEPTGAGPTDADQTTDTSDASTASGAPRRRRRAASRPAGPPSPGSGDEPGPMRADEGKLAHPHPATALLIDQRHRGAEIDIARAARVGHRQMRGIDAVDDFEMPRQ